jgi:hypothetical protein
MADPAALLAQALDAPDAAVVDAALEYLQQVTAPLLVLLAVTMPSSCVCVWQDKS